MSKILKTTDLCKSFSGQSVVNNLSLNIEKIPFMDYWGRMEQEIHNTKNDHRYFEADFWKY